MEDKKVLYDHGTEIVITSKEELQELAENMPDGVVLSVTIDKEGEENYGK